MRSRPSPSLAALAALTVVYFAAGKLGLSLAFVNSSASPVWPPTGIALAALLVLGYRAWPAILLGAFLVNVTNTGHVPTSLVIGLGNTAEALAGAYLVDRFARGRHAFERARDIFTFTLLAALASTTISATVGVTSLVWAGLAAASQYGAIWTTWWLGDAAGALVATPVLLLWSSWSPRAWKKRQIAEGIVLLAGPRARRRPRVRRPEPLRHLELSVGILLPPAARLDGVSIQPARGGLGDHPDRGDRDLGHAVRARPVRAPHAERVAAAAAAVPRRHHDHDHGARGRRRRAPARPGVALAARVRGRQRASRESSS